MQTNILLPTHFDSGNRGCEAITKGTNKILCDDRTQLIAYSRDIDLDRKLGYPEIHMEKISYHSFFSKVLFRIKRKLAKTENEKVEILYRHKYDTFFKDVKKEDIVLSTGGDMFCYENNELIFINDYLSREGIISILWGCSIGKENLTPEKVETLKRFSAITVRESLTQKMLIEELHIDNVKLFPDSAFVLEGDECKLPDYFFENDVIGINLSNFVGADVGVDTVFGKNIVSLIKYIIEKTELTIVLVPHVFWKGQDDRIICKNVYETFSNTGRVHILETGDMTYCQIRYAISKCRFFIGARTHAIISAYAMCIPALALGYSIKSKGIALDLGLPDELVVNYKSLVREDELIKAFQYLSENEDGIRNHLRKTMPEYSAKAFEAKRVIEDLHERVKKHDRNQR